MPFTRRQFMAGSLGTLGALGSGGWRCPMPPLTPFEGIYTDRFTYRQSDSVVVYAALSTPKTVDIDLLRLDISVTSRVARYPTSVSYFGNPSLPGMLGAGFSSVLEIPLSGMSPGLYEVMIPPEAMQEQNRFNTYHQYTSTNSEARFVITADEPGSHSRLLWVHDSLTGACYGSFGGQSIYGPAVVAVRTVSFARPGLDRATLMLPSLRGLRQSGFEFEYIDLVELAQVDPSYLDSYDLIVLIGQFEYVPQAVMEKLATYLDGGGNVFSSGGEFAIFRVRLDTSTNQLTTYKDEFEQEDPLYGTGSEHVAGVGMNIPETVWEPEIIGQTLWAGYYVTSPTGTADLTLHHGAQAGWILDGTGLGDGDVLPAAVGMFGAGNLIAFDDTGAPFVVDQERTRTPDGTTVWATVPSQDARQWWHGGPIGYWPSFSGYATATYQQRPSGAQVVTVPSGLMIHERLEDPTYATILTNIVGRLSTRS